MNSRRSGNLVAASLLLFPLTVAAQDTPRLELFGGYSNLGLTGQPGLRLAPAGLSGWGASAKLNVTTSLGLVADFSVHYGRRGLMPYTIDGLATPGEPRRVEATPGDMRQHILMLGPEVRMLRRERISVNVRALMGVAHTSRLVLKLREPIQLPSGLAITERVVPSANMFAASFGGSIDYRITSRLSYRIVQPELLLTRLASGNTGDWNRYDFRLSSGIVFAPGGSSLSRYPERPFSIGVVGGAGLTDAFGHESIGFIVWPGSGVQPIRSRTYSTLKDYVIGPSIEIGLPWRDLAVEINALYRPMNLTMAGVASDGSLHSISPATVVTWQFPMLAKYRFGARSLRPFVEAGPSFRTAGNTNGASPSAYGGTAGLGFEARLGILRIGPVLRYTHWAGDTDGHDRTRRNQVELLLGLSF